MLAATIALELPHTLRMKSDSLNTARKAQQIVRGQLEYLMPANADAPHRHERVPNGDAWHQLHQQVEHRSPATIQLQ